MRPAAIPTFLIAALAMAGAARGAAPGAMSLNENWRIRSSAEVKSTGETIAMPFFRTDEWIPATVPATVMGALVDAKVYPDPFFGINFRALPGIGYPIGVNFSNLPMPPDSPFRVSWWFRREFTVDLSMGERAWLFFDGINFRANIWLNGRRLADSKKIAGAYRMWEFDITDGIVAGNVNALALEIFPPQPEDLALNWVDWNPTPPDKNMGIWRDVHLRTSGPVTLRYPQVVTKVAMPALDSARLTISAELRNAASRPVEAVLRGNIEKIVFEQAVKLAPNETRKVVFTPDQFPQLGIARPRLWWPVHAGPQNLYLLGLQVVAGGKLSDQGGTRFGIREVTSELNAMKHRVFKVNGKPVLIRGGGWATDVFLRRSPGREAAELSYVKDMNLNAIRFEGKTEWKGFLERCDREGILVIAGWCCCDHWEKWDKWDEEDHMISAESLRDQIRRIRNHPSVFVWWNGSDGPPPERVERRYLDVLRECEWPNPVQSSATQKPTGVSGETGLRMTGPYEWVPPVYWYVDTKRGGAYSFNTETSPGPAVPPVESLRRFIPKEHLWPIDEYWNFHAGGGAFKTVNIFSDALAKRYGPPAGIEDYAKKAQVACYDGQRAMFEAYARNKYASTGVIQWMMNNAWPSLIWHLYDYYLRPAGGYFGAKKACEPVHIQYSYDDRSVILVSSRQEALRGLRAEIRVLNLDMTEKHALRLNADLEADGSRRIHTLPEIAGLSPVYFLKLSLVDSAGKPLSSNFYWLSTRADTLNDAKATWFYTPQESFADFTALSSLPAAQVRVAARSVRRGAEETARVTLENTGRGLAFFVRLKLTQGKGGEEVLPILWEDNYVSLLPGEKREIGGLFGQAQLAGAAPYLEVEGYNLAPQALAVR